MSIFSRRKTPPPPSSRAGYHAYLGTVDPTSPIHRGNLHVGLRSGGRPRGAHAVGNGSAAKRVVLDTNVLIFLLAYRDAEQPSSIIVKGQLGPLLLTNADPQLDLAV